MNQKGRSMIEMLGVLAIIGVLSVGGIAGYSKAMEKYKINKTVNEISHIVMNIRETFKNEKDYSSLANRNNAWYSYNVELLKKNHIFPEYMWSGDDLINAFGGKATVMNNSSYPAFFIVYEGLSQNVCRSLITTDWQNDQGLIAASVCNMSYGSNCDLSYLHECIEYPDSEVVYGDGEIYSCRKTMPITPNLASENCQCQNADCLLILLYQ